MSLITQILHKKGIKPVFTEYKFHSVRRWRIDYAIPDVMLAIEIEGGAFTMGRHTRGAGFVKDIEKYNALTESGWALLRYTPSKIDYDQIERVHKILKNRLK